MRPQRQCTQCGKLLPDVDDANCPACLLEWGLSSSLDEPPTVSDGRAPVAFGSGVPEQPGLFRRLHYFGDYELIEEIARGGMGVVYRARQVSLNRTVAVKMIVAAQFAGTEVIRRFQIEARAAASLRHPNIVGVHEVGEHEGFHYFSMDYIEGKDLGQTIRENSVSPRRATEWVKTIADAIHYAHEQGILHRDLKPSNILIDWAGVPHVTDFGLATELETRSGITVSGQILGSPNYMPPEQAGSRREQVGRASDVYSLGAVLYHLIAGRPPFVGENAAGTLQSVLHEEVISPRIINPNTPPDLETICLKCLEKEPARRYQTARELAHELNRFLCDEPILARPIPRKEKIWRWCRRKPLIAALTASLVAVFFAGLVGVLTQLRRAEIKSEENRKQIARLNVLTGVQLMQGGDYFKSLLWFVEALAIDSGAPEREGIHHQRVAAVLEQCPKLVQIISHDGQPLAAASFSPADDRLATVGADHTARVWAIPGGQLLMKTPPLPALPLSVTFNPSGTQLLIVLLDDTARLIDPASGLELVTPLPHRTEVAGNSAFLPVFDPTGMKLLTQPRAKELQIWDPASGRSLGGPLVHSNAIERAQFSADGSRLFTRAQRNFAWDSQTGEPLIFSANSSDLAETFFVSRHSAAGVLGGRIMKWPFDVEPGEPLMDPMLLIWADFSPSGDRLITAGFDRTARIWDAATGQPLTPPLAHDQAVWSAEFSPDGRRVLTVSLDNLRRVWDADTGRPLTPSIGHATIARASAFSGSGRYVLTVHPEFVAYVWDLQQQATSPVPLRPLQPIGINEVAARGQASVSREMNNLIRVRSLTGGPDVPLHPISVKTVPMQAWFDATSRFVVVEGEMARAQVWDAESGMPVTPLVQGQYTLDESAYNTVKLPASTLSASEAMLLAQVLSGSRLDGTGGWTPLSLEEIIAGWKRLNDEAGMRNPPLAVDSKPSSFRRSVMGLETWHEQEAQAAAGALDWFATAFHWERLARLPRNGSRFTSLGTYARLCLANARSSAKSYAELRRVIPLRDGRVDGRLIDLSDHYTGPVPDGMQAGVQRLGGVEFDGRGQIELFGSGSGRRGFGYRDGVSGVQIRQRCARMHFLHTAKTMANTRNDEPIAILVVVYADGQTERMAIRNRVHVSDHWSRPELAPSQAEVAWIGTNPFANALQQSVWVYKYSWSNPHPDWEISHLDLISGDGEASYILVAITAD